MKQNENRTSELDDTLAKAFGIAMDEIDTNAYRRERNRLFNGLTQDIFVNTYIMY